MKCIGTVCKSHKVYVKVTSPARCISHIGEKSCRYGLVKYTQYCTHIWKIDHIKFCLMMENYFRDVQNIRKNVYDIIISPIYHSIHICGAVE